MTNEEERESTDCVDFMYKIDERNNTIKFIFSDGTVKTANLGALKGIWGAQSEFKKKAEVVISQLRDDRDQLLYAIADIKAEIESEPYVSKMEVLEIIDKHTKES